MLKKATFPIMSTALENVIIVADEKVTTDANGNPVGVGGCTMKRSGPSCENRNVRASASGRWPGNEA
jgi:hypothetical protein